MTARACSKPTLAERFWQKVSRRGEDECWPWLAYRNEWGYGTIGTPAAIGVELAHRVSWQLHKGPIPDGMLVLHRCDNPPCVNPAHLFLGTDADNSHDRDAKGRLQPLRGERHGCSRLTEDDVRNIRVLRGEVDRKILALYFGVTPSMISAIQLRRNWRHVS